MQRGERWRARIAAAVLTALTVGTVLGQPSAATAAPGSPSVPFVTIAAGKTSDIHQPLQVTIRDRDAWQTLWRRHTGRADPAPAVDFTREMVVALFAGTSAAPRTATITRIVREPERLVVWYLVRETLPAPEPGLPATSPYHIVRLPRSPLPVAFSPVKAFPVVRP